MRRSKLYRVRYDKDKEMYIVVLTSTQVTDESHDVLVGEYLHWSKVVAIVSVDYAFRYGTKTQDVVTTVAFKSGDKTWLEAREVEREV